MCGAVWGWDIDIDIDTDVDIDIDIDIDIDTDIAGVQCCDPFCRPHHIHRLCQPVFDFSVYSRLCIKSLPILPLNTKFFNPVSFLLPHLLILCHHLLLSPLLSLFFSPLISSFVAFLSSSLPSSLLSSPVLFLGAMGRYTRVVEMGTEREVHVQPQVGDGDGSGAGGNTYQQGR